MTELSEGDLMALQSQWVELQESAREWLRSDAKQERSRYGSGDVPLPNHDGTGESK